MYSVQPGCRSISAWWTNLPHVLWPEQRQDNIYDIPWNPDWLITGSQFHGPKVKCSQSPSLPAFNIYNDEFHNPSSIPPLPSIKTLTYNFHFVRVFEHPHVKNTNVFSAIKKTEPDKPTYNPTRRFPPTPRGTQWKPPRPSAASVVASEAPSLKASEAFLVAGWAAMAAAWRTKRCSWNYGEGGNPTSRETSVTKPICI